MNGPMTGRLTTAEMADFVTDGVLTLEAVVPEPLNTRVLAELPALLDDKLAVLAGREPVDAGPDTGTPIDECRPGSALAEVLSLPRVRAVIESLVGPGARFDHDFVHHLPAGHDRPQHLHADAVADTADPSFDIQLFYHPHAIGPGGGGTRLVPGTHLRRATSTTLARYQHLVGERYVTCPAGTILVFHHGLWHAGDVNRGDTDRWLYKLRLNPAVAQVRLWDTSDPNDHDPNDPGGGGDHIFATARPGSVAATLRRGHGWQSNDALRYDLMERVRLWRHLTGDDRFDVDHYLTRLDRPLGTPSEAAANRAGGGSEARAAVRREPVGG